MLIKILFILLFCIGLIGVLSPRNLIRKIIGLSILNSSVVFLYVLAGRIDGVSAPILTAAARAGVKVGAGAELEAGAAIGAGTKAVTGAESVVVFVDPIPQALMLTAIVVGLSVTAVALVLAVQLSRLTGTLDITEIEAGINDHVE